MKRFAPSASLALLAAALCASRAAAQEVPAGARIRIIPIGVAAPTEGSLVAMRTDTISVRLGLSNTLVSMSMDSVRAVDLSKGVYTGFGHTIRDGAIGFASGAGIVGLIGAGVCPHSGNDLCDVDAVLTAIPVGLVGMFIGLHVAQSHKREHWERVYDRPSTALLIGPAPRGGFEIGLSIPFGGGAER